MRQIDISDIKINYEDEFIEGQTLLGFQSETRTLKSEEASARKVEEGTDWGTQNIKAGRWTLHMRFVVNTPSIEGQFFFLGGGEGIL